MIRFLPIGTDWPTHLSRARDRMVRAAKPETVEQAGGAQPFRAMVRHLVAVAELHRFETEPLLQSERDLFEGRVRDEAREAAAEAERHGMATFSLAEVRSGALAVQWRPTWPEEVEEQRLAPVTPPKGALPDFYDDKAKAARFREVHRGASPAAVLPDPYDEKAEAARFAHFYEVRAKAARAARGH